MKTEIVSGCLKQGRLVRPCVGDFSIIQSCELGVGISGYYGMERLASNYGTVNIR